MRKLWLESGTCIGSSDRAWYWLQSLAPEMFPVTEPGTVPVPDCTGDSGTSSDTGAKFSSGRVLVQFRQ